MTIKEITEAAERVLSMMTEYKGVGGQGELGADRLLYGLLEGSFGKMGRQHTVQHGRIDFRYGTSNPVVIEIVLRKPKDPRYKLYASQNSAELRKLTRVRQTTAKTRILLLLDRSRDPIPEQVLRPGYSKSHAGRGNFKRHSVRVVYAHRSSTYDFLWKPKKAP